MDYKTSSSQRKAVRNYEKQNKERTRYIKDRSACRSFIRNKATIDDLNEIIFLATEYKKIRIKLEKGGN